MAIRTKINLLAKLKDCGYSSYKLRQEKIIGESVIQKLRSGGLPSWNELDLICKLTHSKIEDLVEYIPDEESMP